jgi:hypothetical protein
MSQSSYTPPTDEQLERFIFALVQGEAFRRGIEVNAAWGAKMAMRNPVLKEAWLQRHRDLAAGLAHPVEIDDDGGMDGPDGY